MSTTVNGTIKNKGEAVLQKRTLTFKCLDGATVLGTALAIPDPDITVTTGVDGTFSKVLAPGNYELWMGTVKYCTLTVPTSGTVRLEDISDIAATAELNIYESVLIRASDNALVRLKVEPADGGGYTVALYPV